MEKLHSLCSLLGDKWSIDGLHCEFDLPSDPLGKPRIKARFSEKQYRSILDHSSRFELKSVVEDEFGPEMKIEGTGCWFKKRKATHWPHGLTSYEGEITPSGLYVKTFLDRSGGHQGGATHYEFRLTHNPWADPGHMRTLSYTGEVSISRFTLLSVQKGVEQFSIDTRYDYIELPEDNGYQANKTLVVRVEDANFQEGTPPENIDYVPIDDICRLIQLASRHYIVCLGMTVTSQTFHAQHYRLDRVRPATKSINASHDDYLIDRSLAQEFLQQAYDTFSASKGWGDRIRSAIASLVQPSTGTIEGRFMAQFSALEELIEEHTKNEGSVRILGQRQFRKLGSKIKSVITDAVDDESARQKILRQLPALNNVSLQDRFESFCNAKGVQYTDLWPVFSGSSASLYKIRNRFESPPVY